MAKRFSALFVLGLVFPVAGYAAPTELDACLVDGAGLSCIVVHPTYGGSAACEQGTFIPWLHFVGPLVWTPLTYAGPITIEAQVFGGFRTQLPLYIEVVPVTDPRYLCTLPGYVVGTVYAGSNETDRCGKMGDSWTRRRLERRLARLAVCHPLPRVRLGP